MLAIFYGCGGALTWGCEALVPRAPGSHAVMFWELRDSVNDFTMLVNQRRGVNMPLSDV